MKHSTIAACCAAICGAILFFSCTQPSNLANVTSDSTKVAVQSFGGFESQAKWGEHIVNIAGCNDCHTPKKMGPHGPENDSSLLLSGHPAQMPIANIDRKLAETKGLAVSTTETAWIGPWGVTFAANLTPDSTGLGNWTEEQFLKCLKQDKWMGLDNTRPLLPPMPVTSTMNMREDELKAIFAYLKTIKPVHNTPPAYMPPVTAMKH